MKQLLLFLFLFFGILAMSQERDDKSRLFEKIDPLYSSVLFNNVIKENIHTRENLLDFDYFYNGAGIAIGDINNDGLPDLFFSANQVQNRLYLNKGNFQFEDITSSSGINAGKMWSNGVTMADVNGDGWLDIYVSQGGPYAFDERPNLLYINQGDLHFIESAAAYGLDDKGISTQSAFFDYDLDGDLDCFVINESEVYGLDPISFNRMMLENPIKARASYSHLYRNDNGIFKDVSQKSGINLPTFGLGLVISDINDDGWPDIYIANDYYLPDNLYINRKNGSFIDRAGTMLHQLSFYGMGADIADIDNDGYQDIYVLDMASKDHYRAKTLMASMNVANFSLLVDGFQYPHQYMFNSLHLNDRHGRFNNVAHFAGVAKTDWSWAALIEDFDLDGNKDIFVTNGFRKYALDNDFKAKVNELKEKYSGFVPDDEKAKLYQSMPSEALSNVMFRNNGNLQFSELADEWGLGEPSFSNGAAVADLDGDGDLDIVINNIDQTASIYKNNAIESNNVEFVSIDLKNVKPGEILKLMLYFPGSIQMIEPKNVRGYMSSMPWSNRFGIVPGQKIDSLVVSSNLDYSIIIKDIPKNKEFELDLGRADKRPGINKENIKSKFAVLSAQALGLDFVHEEDDFNDFEKEILLPQKQSTMGPDVVVGDLNSDGIDDILVTGAAGQASVIYLQGGDGFEKGMCTPCEQYAEYEDVSALIFDADGDSFQDIYMLGGGNSFPENDKRYADRLYLNDKNGDFYDASAQLLFDNHFVGSKAASFDFDNDGDLDLILANRINGQRYPISAPSFILENQGGKFIDVTSQITPEFSQLGIVNDFILSDFNNDGLNDLIIVGEWEPVYWFENQGGIFKLSPKPMNAGSLNQGWWYSIKETDINGDGLPDYILGNIGRNYKHNPSNDKPLHVYANDFDETGTLDIVLSNTYNNKMVPVRGKECSTQQMPFISQKFPEYNLFATASLSDIYGEGLNKAYHKFATDFSSYLLINIGGGDFKWILLPVEAQLFPILDVLKGDFNKDGFEDLLLAGCIYETEVETPRLDAGHGLVLLSDGKSNYSVDKSGNFDIYLPGNVKSLNLFKDKKGKTFILAGKNNEGLSLFMIK